ncbi:MAG: MTH1187 family thiamine-binding protein [Bacteroidales bacterium]|nr:MTH1187 family thiamine-binding protein [Bacteroidales bacterium]
MSTILNFAIFPTDKGDKGASEYVSKVLKMIAESGVPYKLNPMGTSIETDTLEEALEIVNKSYKVLEPFSERVYSAITIDIRKGRSNGMKQKIESIEKRIGSVEH